jgi:hypothetical protein
VAAGVIAGSYIDAYLGTAPWFTLLLTVGTLVGAVYRLLWLLGRFGRDGADGSS